MRVPTNTSAGHRRLPADLEPDVPPVPPAETVPVTPVSPVTAAAAPPTNAGPAAPSRGTKRAAPPATPPALPDLEAAPAADVVGWALERFHPSIALACSFQKEEAVLLDLLFRANPDARVFALDTGVLFDETYELWRQTEARYDTKIERWSGPTLVEQAATHGDKLWERNPSQCCGLRKVAPLREGLSHLDAWITGIRRDQSPARANAGKVEWDDAFGLVKANPLADWSDKDVWKYVVEHDLPYNPLHDQGYSSIGCVPCTRVGEGREGRWAGSAKVECGLHQEDA